MTPFHTTDAATFFKYLGAIHPVIFLKFPKGMSYIVDGYKINAPKGDLSEQEYQQFQLILNSWLKDNRFI